MPEQLPPVPTKECFEEACGKCPIDTLQLEHERDNWHGVVASATATLERYDVKDVRFQWLETALAVEDEVRHGNKEAGEKSLGSLAAAGCLRMKLGEDFEKLVAEK